MNFLKKSKIASSRLKAFLKFDFSKLADQNNQLSDKLKEIEIKFSTANSQLSSIEKQLSRLGGWFDYSNLDLLHLNHTTTNKKKVLLCGFYGAFNAGDEYILQTILDYLSDEDNLEITIMLCDNRNTDITNYGKCKFIHYPRNIFDFNHLANYYDAVFFGGGALLDDVDYGNPDIPFTFGYILVNLAMRFITFDKPTILYGMSSNAKLSSPEFIQKLNFIAENATHFSLRDTNSLSTLKKAGINIKHIKIVNDIVFSSTLLANYKPANHKTKPSVINIGIVLICSQDTNLQNINNIRSLIKYLNRNKINFHLNFIPFYNYLNNDTVYYKNLIEKLNISDSVTSITPFSLQLKSVIDEFNRQDVVISMRYHGSLIANAMGKQTLTLMPDNKHRHYPNKMKYLHSHYGFRQGPLNLSTQINPSNLKALLNKQHFSCNNLSQIFATSQKNLKEAIDILLNKAK